MALIISYHIIYLLWNVTPVATRGINEEPNIYVGTRSSATQITPLLSTSSAQPRAIPWATSTFLYYRQKVSLGLRRASSHLHN